MLITILLAAIHMLPMPASPTPTVDPAFPPSARGLAARAKCPHATVRQAEGREALRPRRFNELPSGRLELAVMREVDGCPIPAVLQEGIGGSPARR
jgi:hypothetical protein